MSSRAGRSKEAWRVSVLKNPSYFGVGLAKDDISIGAILQNGIAKFSLYPWQLLAPAFLLAIMIFIFFLLGTALSDALDPRKHR